MNLKTIISYCILIGMILSSCNNEKTANKVTQTFENKVVKRLEKSTYLINSTYLGNARRCFYGNYAPDNLDINWRFYLGKGTTNTGLESKEWAGAGWTGQPLMIKYADTIYLIQGAYDHHLRKIRATDGKQINKFLFDDVIKGTGTIWENKHAKSTKKRFFILQGSRLGIKKKLYSPMVESYKCLSFETFEKEWIYNSKKMLSYSRDVDGSALIINDTAYLGLENGLFIVFDPNPQNAELRNGVLQPKIYDVDTLFYASDNITHGRNLVTESSPSYLNGYVYVSSGAGHIFGYNINKKKIDWVFDTGADMDGSPAVTDDSCLIITIEKEYISGHGGAMKINPARPPAECVEWFFPTATKKYEHWDGGIIGSASINDFYANDTIPKISAFLGIDGFLYVVRHNKLDKTKTAKGPNLKNTYPMPELVFKYNTGASISSPIIVGNKIIAATYFGVYLFEFDKNLNFKLLQHQDLGSFEATPFVWNGKIYLAGRDGYLYCFGK